MVLEIVGVVIDIAESWWKKQVKDTGNAEFIAKWDGYFKLGDSLWEETKTKLSAKK